MTLITLALTLLAGAPSTHAAVTCDRYASPSGSDTATGTLQAPYRSVQKLVDSVSSGQTACLRAGSYTGNVKVSRAGIKLTNYGTEKATVIGRFWVARGADGVTVEGLYLNGKNAAILPSPTINAQNTTFIRNDVTNDNTGICFILGHEDYGRAVRTRIELNRIHNCGRLPVTNLDHGIYVGAGDDNVITRNWIYDNADFGVHLSPDAQRTVVTGNVIDGNGMGLTFSGEVDSASNDNVVENNLISNSKVRENVESWYPGPVGTGNVARHNCIGGGVRDNGDGGIGDQIGFDAVDNALVAPGYRNRAAKDFRLSENSICRSVYVYSDEVPGPDMPSFPGPSGEEDESSTSPSSPSASTGPTSSPSVTPTAQRTKKKKRARRAKYAKFRGAGRKSAAA